ncbi:MAG: single-stranded-DNA-specific exonuclease RecJ [Gammaproteobacteria bacterium]|nr:single-stranded-DNA-specific exonuclease RecJ [Gammaproteobacteria bacterium]
MLIKQRPIADNLDHWHDVDPLVARIYAARGISVSDADLSLKGMADYKQLLNIDSACERLKQAIFQDEHIVVIGDFDADGATASALAVAALKAFAARKVGFLVPNRFEYGYGLSEGIVEEAQRQGAQLIITVDNGISSHQGVSLANRLGIDVIITDHHLAGETLPEAHAIINPNQPHCRFPSKAIAGVGVIFYVMSALRKVLSDANWFVDKPMPNMVQFLDLLALGTIADVVPLDKNNRILVKQGLLRIQQGLARPGINALLQVAGRQAHRLKASDLGFAIGPRLNAAGRLDDMSLGISCLLADDINEALPKARQLDTLNQERRQIEGEMQAQAMLAIEKIYGSFNLSESQAAGICLYDESWHQGVIGILAGRLKDKFHKPAIVFAKGQHDELKASARSVIGLNIRDLLAAIDLQYPGLMLKFGGHAMAAGLSIRGVDFAKFKHAFEGMLALHAIEIDHTIYSDGQLKGKDFNLKTAHILNQAGPWGQLFPEPCFDNQFEILDQRLVGKNHLKLTLRPLEEDIIIDAIAFNIDLDHWPNQRIKRIHAAYQLDINEYQGRQRLQLMINAMEAVAHDVYQELV